MAEDWARLARAVETRRRELRLSQDDIRAAGGPSDVVLSRIEHNEAPHPRGNTLQKLDAPLRWQPGSAVTILNGGDPVDLDAPPVPVEDIPTDTLLSELRRRLARARRAVATLESEPGNHWFEVDERKEREGEMRVNPNAPIV